MAYFPNGTSGMLYEEKYCDKCIHSGNCVIWDLHMFHNYDECNNKDSMLHVLIPRNEDGIGNKQCSMFISADQNPKGDQ